MLKTIPIAIIIVLTFILIFSATDLTIKAATKLSYACLFLLLTSQAMLVYYGHMNKQIYIKLVAALLLLGLLYTLYIKRIYSQEEEIIKDLKEKDIVEDTNIVC
jgi:Ca2+/Na+ antiporter